MKVSELGDPWMLIPVLRCTSCSYSPDGTFSLCRQNRIDRLLRKRWSHIAADLITLLENNELNVISLKVNEQKNSQHGGFSQHSLTY